MFLGEIKNIHIFIHTHSQTHITPRAAKQLASKYDSSHPAN